LGIIIGAFMRLAGVQDANELLTFDDEVFFLFLIPPIILHAGYFLDQKFFFNNIWLILWYALIGTLLSTLLVGTSLWGTSPLFQYKYTYLDLLLFGALISAVDPVAVLAIFEELHVNETLNILVFGESVLNDAVSIVLYRLFESLRLADHNDQLEAHAMVVILLGIAKFIYVSVGGVAIGLIVGLLCAFTTKFTNRVQIIEPLIVVIFGFLAYFLAEALLSSGIMSILFCGAIMARYVELNVEKKSHIVIKWTLTAVGVTAENMIFIYLGISIVVHDHFFDFFFIFFTLLFMMTFRFFLVFSIGSFDNYILRRNQRKKDRINMRTMFVIAFGGLRGAIAFALAFIIPQSLLKPDGEESFVAERRSIITTTLIVIIFTIFIQGSMMRPLLKILKIRGTKQTEKQLKEDLKGEQDFLHHEEKEISQAVEKIEYLEKSMSIMPPSAEKQDFIDANTKVMRSITQHIVGHVDNIIVDLEKMNSNIRKLMELDAADKKNSQNARDIMNWRLEKAADIRVSWRSQLDDMDIAQRYRASKSVNEIIRHLRTQLFQLSKRPTKIDSDTEEESIVEDDRYEANGAEKNGQSSVEPTPYNRPNVAEQNNATKVRRRHHSGKKKLSSTKKHQTYDQMITNFDPIEYEDTSFIEILHLHDMLEFGYDSYHTVTWARDDDYLFFLDRTLLLESLKSWNDYALEMLRAEDVTHSLQMLKYLRKLIHIQIENRLNELTHLKKEAFADVVFGFGVKRAQPIANAAAKSPTIARRIRNFLRHVDEHIQKLVVRGLHSEEQKLIFALRKIRKDEMEEGAYHEINLAYDEVVQHHGIKKLTEKTLKKEADAMDEVLVPEFLRMLHLKENPARFIRDELTEYRKNRKKKWSSSSNDNRSERNGIPRVASVSWEAGLGSGMSRLGSNSVFGDDDDSDVDGHHNYIIPERDGDTNDTRRQSVLFDTSQFRDSVAKRPSSSSGRKSSLKNGLLLPRLTDEPHSADVTTSSVERQLVDDERKSIPSSREKLVGDHDDNCSHVKWADHEGVPLEEERTFSKQTNDEGKPTDKTETQTTPPPKQQHSDGDHREPKDDGSTQTSSPTSIPFTPIQRGELTMCGGEPETTANDPYVLARQKTLSMGERYSAPLKEGQSSMTEQKAAQMTEVRAKREELSREAQPPSPIVESVPSFEDSREMKEDVKEGSQVL